MIDWIKRKIEEMDYREKLDSIEEFCRLHNLTMEQVAQICDVIGVDVEHVMGSK